MNDGCVLDTHAWILLQRGLDAMPPRVRRRLRRGDAAYVPAISLREVALLVEQRRLTIAPGRDGIDAWMRAALRAPCEIAPLTPEIAVESVKLAHEGFHRDPSDQMIYATARVLGVPLITRDEAIHAFERGLPRTAKRLAVWA